MPDPESLAMLTQFGTAGLIGWMWLVERRAAAERDTQLHQLHDRLMQERRGLEVAVEALRDNTRVLAGVEAGQRALATTLERLLGSPPLGSPVLRTGRLSHPDHAKSAEHPE